MGLILGWAGSGLCDDKQYRGLDDRLRHLGNTYGFSYEYVAGWGLVAALVAIGIDWLLSMERQWVPAVLLATASRSAAVGRVSLILTGLALASVTHYTSFVGPLTSKLGTRVPVGMFSGAKHDPKQGGTFFVVAGYTKGGANDTEIMDWYPWGEDAAPRALLAKPPVVSLTHANTRWIRILQTGVKDKTNPTFWSKFGTNMCRQYARQRLSVFQIHKFVVSNPSGIKPMPKPTKQTLWSHTCHIMQQIKCSHPDCPWSNISIAVTNQYDKVYVYKPSQALGAFVSFCASGACGRARTCAAVHHSGAGNLVAAGTRRRGASD